MGFFSDLKEDLSQAVNELMPEEELQESSRPVVQKERIAGGTKASKPSFEEQFTRLDAQESASKDFLTNNSNDSLMRMLDDAEEKVKVGGKVKEERERHVDERVHTNEKAKVNETENVKPVKEEIEDIEVKEIKEVKEVREEVKEKPISMPGIVAKKSTEETSVLTESMLINGNIATEGALDVRGSIVGNVEALGKLNITGAIQGNSQAAEIFADGARITGELRSQGSVKIGQSTVILGNIFASSAVVAGAVKGDIDVKGPVILDTSAIVMGDIKAKSMQINNGAVVEGMCSLCYADVNPNSFFEEISKAK